MIRILVIDDEWGMRTGAKRILEQEGYEVEITGNGAGARELARTAPFDVYIVDLKLPDVDGLALLREFHKYDKHSVCIVITAYASLETAIEATRRGAWDFLPKPFTPQALRAVVSRAAERRLLLEEADRLRQEREERLLELASERSRISTILSNLTTGVIVINEQGQLVLFNTAALSLICENSLVNGNNFIDQLPDCELRDAIGTLLDDSIEEAIHTTLETPGRSDGQVLNITVTPVPSPAGGISGRTISIRDVTTRVELDRAKSNFVRVVSHEVKAPVGAVIGFIDMILEGYASTEEKKIQYLIRSRKRLNGLVTMVKDLLSITRQEEGSIKRSFQSINLTTLVERVVESMEPDWRSMSLSIDIDSASVPEIAGDETSLEQIFTNLISNAIKYNIHSGRIDISLRPSGDGVETRIADTGIGIEEECLSRIWEPFYRIKSDDTREINGTGLGLSIVHKIVETHKGRIEIESEPGTGTTFTLWLPCAPGKMAPFTDTVT